MSSQGSAGIRDGLHDRSAQGETMKTQSALLAVLLKMPFLLYGIYAFVFGIFMYLIGVLMVVPRYVLVSYVQLTTISELLVWYSGIPIVVGFALSLFDLLLLFERKRPLGGLITSQVDTDNVTVALTAYNDEESIVEAVKDFLAHPKVRRVIVVSNNSQDRTLEFARQAGAVAINEPHQGYGHCVYRCYEEALSFEDAEIIVLCEGDRTFRSIDIDKLVSFAPHADIVNGTRIVEPLRERHTQLTTFMFYGNLFVAKLLEAKHLGYGTVTDVGSTYKLCRRSALAKLLPQLNRAINLEFNAHFIDKALGSGLVFVECPITFYARVGQSKGGNVHNRRAFGVGFRMMLGLTFGWKST
jgi:hypothetical protein